MLLILLACSKSDSVTDSGLVSDSDEECEPTWWYADLDGDGYGRVGSGTEACIAPFENVDNDLDCDDTDPLRNPDAPEIPANGQDDDCDGFEDCYEDADGDAYGTSTTVPSADVDCGGEGEADNDADCDDTRAAVNPDGIEDCNGVDDDCDGTVDEDAGEIGTWFADTDGDGYGDPDNAVRGCSQPSGSVEDSTDCDDSEPTVHPGGTEVCNGLDDDCDASTSEDGMVLHSDGTDMTADFTGSPATPSIVADGTVWICDGTYEVNVSVAAEATLASLSGDATAVVLDGAGVGPVIGMGAAVDATLEDLTITNGLGNDDLFTDLSGGGILCIGGASTSSVTLSGVVIDDNEADLGGGIATYLCDTTLVDVTLSDNSVSILGGGALLLDGTHDWSSVTVEDNSSGEDVGGVHFYGYADGVEVLLDEVVFRGNSAADLAGAAAITDGTAEWTGTSSTESGLFGNTDTAGNGGLFLSAAEVEFDTVDLGEGSDDNDAADVYLYASDGNGLSYAGGDDLSFSCDADACGSEVEYTLGANDEESSVIDMAVFDVVLADTDATLNRVEIYAQVDTGCQLDFYVLEATSVSDGSTSWTMAWGNSETGDATGAGLGWNTSDDIGVLVESGTYYAVGVGFQNCSTANVATTESPSTDAGFGTATGSAVEDSYTTVLSTSTSNSLDYDSSNAAPYRIRVAVTEL